MFERILNVLAKNMGYTLLLVVSLLMFAVFSDGRLIAGLITAVSAMLVYACAVALYKEYKKLGTVKTVSAHTKPAKKKPATKK